MHKFIFEIKENAIGVFALNTAECAKVVEKIPLTFCNKLIICIWAMGYGLWAMGYGLWAMGYGLWAMGYDEFIVAAADAIGASGAFVRRFFSNISVINFSRPKYALFEN